MIRLKAGSRWRSAVCEVEVIVIRAPTDPVNLACGGSTMVPVGEKVTPLDRIDPTLADGTHLGKRYADATTGIELLCTRSGDGTLTINGDRIALKEAKPLPSSD